MAGVTPPGDGGYQYYRKKVDELEDELTETQKRNREKQAEHEEKLEKAYTTDLRRQERSAQSTVDTIREDAAGVHSREREKSKDDLAKLQQQTYDRLGRYNGLDVEGMKDRLEATNKTLEDERTGYQKRVSNLEHGFATRGEEREKEHRLRAERAIEASRNASANSSADQHANAAEIDRLHTQDLENRFEHQVNAQQDALNSERQRYSAAARDMQESHERFAGQAGREADERLDRQSRSFNARMESAQRNMAASHTNDTKVYRDQVHELLDNERRYAKEVGQGTQDVIRRYDGENRADKVAIVDSYERDLKNERAKGKQSEAAFSEMHNSTLKERDAYFAGVLSKQNQEHGRDLRDVQQTFDRDRQVMQEQADRDKTLLQNSASRQLSDANSQRDVILMKQARAYQQTLESNRLNDQTKIHSLEKELNTKTTSEDPNEVSPAAEASIRRSLGREYGANFDTERTRNAQSEESIRANYAQRLRDTVTDTQAEKAAMRLSHTSQDHELRTEFLNHNYDTEQLNRQSRIAQEQDQTRQLDRTSKKYEESVKRQQRQSEDQINTLRDSSSAKITAQRQDAEFQMKMAQRSFSAEQNELIRNYEKKLADQRLESQDLVDRTKEETQKQLREADRQARSAIDDQARSYEHRIAQMEFQQKERERFLTQSHEDALDKVKRSHAALIQKKS